MLHSWLIAFALLSQNPAPDAAPAPTSVGPAAGSLVVVGGGALPPEIIAAFVERAGGRDAEVVMIPTAGEDPVDPEREARAFARAFGFTRVTALHTRDRSVADSEAFVAPLRTARAVWFGGGRQWRFVDSYLDTRTQREIEGVLARGGVIGGSSAGATIQGSYLVRGAREGNERMMAPGYERGFGYLRGVAVDQHTLPRRRVRDMAPVIRAHPELLGLGVDEATAAIVQGDEFRVIGRGVVAITDGRDHDGRPYYLIATGERFDLKRRALLPPD